MDNSPLAKLPPELLNDVVERVIPQNEDRRIPITADPMTGKLHTTVAIAETRPTAVIQVCKQLRATYTKLCYARHCTFAIRYFDNYCGDKGEDVRDSKKDELAILRRFEANLGPKIFSMIKDIKITIARARTSPLFHNQRFRQQMVNIGKVASDNAACIFSLKFRLDFQKHRQTPGRDYYPEHYTYVRLGPQHLDVMLEKTVKQLQARKTPLPPGLQWSHLPHRAHAIARLSMMRDVGVALMLVWGEGVDQGILEA